MINRDQFNLAYKLIEELDQLENLVSRPSEIVAPLLPESIENEILRANLAIINNRRMQIKDLLKGYSIRV